MNIYRTQFSCLCPVNGDRIFYALKIESERQIMAEAIQAAVDKLPDAWLHEAIADDLHEWLGGQQTITAQHRAVHIETVRGQP